MEKRRRLLLALVPLMGAMSGCFLQDTTAPPPKAPRLAVVLAGTVNVRSDPRVETGNVVGTIQCGDIVAVLGREGDEWYEVKLNELQGYAHGSFMVPLGPGGKRPLCESSSLQPLHAAAVLDRPAVRHPGPNPIKQKKGHPVDEPASGKRAASTSVPTSDGPRKVVLSRPPASAKPVVFPHQLHVNEGFACYKCHHPVSRNGSDITRISGQNANIGSCRACHAANGPVADRVKAKDAFHNTCRDCHRAVGGKAPVGCGDCHK